jgi:F0F1-type ATP synthase membrane subunit c/vacuolar-type H+-ATPase subunit K
MTNTQLLQEENPMLSLSIIHFFAICATLVIPLFAVAMGQNIICRLAIAVLDQQPESQRSLNKLVVVALAVSETAAVLSLLVSIFLMRESIPTNYLQCLGELAIVSAISIPAAVIGFAASLPIRAALTALERQPLNASKITNLLLLAVSIGQTPIIFGFFLAWLILSRIPDIQSLATGIQLLATGCAFGIGTVGPSIGIARFGQQACTSVGKNRESYKSIFSFTFISQALIETPILFAFVAALLMLLKPLPVTHAFSPFIYIGTALAVSIPTICVGLSSGRIARTACQEIGQNPGLYQMVSRLSILGQTIIDTHAIYGLVVALLMFLGTLP